MNEQQEHPIRIAVVDDHEMFRAGVIATLQPHFNIVGQAPDVEGSVAMIAQTKPDVVLLDVHVPGGEGGHGPTPPIPCFWRCRYRIRRRTSVP